MAALGDLLVEDFVTGECSAVKVGQLARSAIQFCKAMGGQVPSDHPVQKLANIGSSGLHPSNSERDLQRRVKAMALHAKIEHVPVRINSPQQGHIIVKNIAVIFPDSMATALWEAGENIFRHFFFNGVNARKFWKHHGTHCEWFRRHVDYTYDKKSRLIPLSLYGDEVQTFKNTECGIVDILGFTSDFAAGHGPLSRYLPIVAISEHLVCEFTWSDLWQALVPRLQKMVTDTSWKWSASGYKFMISSVQGDMKFLCEP